MKILWVKAGGLVPLDSGGRLRSFNILKELARTHEVTLFTYYPEQRDDPHPDLARLFRRVECHPLEIPASKGWAEAALYARHFFLPLPHSIAKFTPAPLARRLRSLVEQERHDAVVCDFAIAGGVIPWGLVRPVVLFTHNVEALIWQRHYQVARNPIWKAACWREFRKMARAELSYARQADLVLTVSECDREYFARHLSPAKIESIGTGVDLEYFQPADGREAPGLLVFSGSMDWMANDDGICFFIDRILPRIRQEVPDATLQVVGRRPSQRLQALAARVRGIEVTGRVDDIRPYVHKSSVFVVPLRVGSGTRLKIFEAMAMGKAVVSTSIGAEGLPVENGKQIILADDPEDFAHRTAALLTDAQARSDLGRAGRQLVEQSYSWCAIAKQFEQAISKVAGDRVRPPAENA